MTENLLVFFIERGRVLESAVDKQEVKYNM